MMELDNAYTLYRQQLLSYSGDDTFLDDIDPLPMNYEKVYNEKLDEAALIDMSDYSIHGKQHMNELIADYRALASTMTSATQIKETIAKFIASRDKIPNAKEEIIVNVDVPENMNEEQQAAFDTIVSTIAKERLAAKSADEANEIVLGAAARVHEVMDPLMDVDKPLEAIILNKTELEMLEGDTEQLTTTMVPEDTTDLSDVMWASDNTNVATVKDGLITAVSEGTATIIARKGIIEATCQVTVLPRDNQEGFTVAKIQDQAYTGKAIKPQPVVRDGNVVLTLGKDYTLSYKNNVNAGTATVVIKGKGNYTKTVTATFTIAAKELNSDDVKITVPDCKYTGKICKPQVTVKWGSKTLKNGTDYTISYANNVEKDDVNSETRPTVTIVGKGNYAGTVEKTFHIYGVSASTLVVDSVAQQTYTGSPVEPEIKVYASKTAQKAGEALEAGVDYTVTYTNNVNAGTAKAIITGLNQYGGTKTITFTIQKKSIKANQEDIKAILDKTSFTYTGSTQKPGVSVTYGDTVLTEGKDFTVKYANAINAATADSKKAPTVTITGKGNYTGTQTLKFTIEPKDMNNNSEISAIVADVRANGNKAVKPTVVVKDGNKILKNGTNYTLIYENNTAIGEPTDENAPTVAIIGKGNYEGSITKTFRIYEKAASTMAVDKIAAQTYTGDEITPDVTVYANAKDQKAKTNALELGKDYTVTYENNVKAGTGKAIITGLGQYGGTKTINFTIQKKSVKENKNGIKAWLDKTSVIYTGKALKPMVVVTDNGKVLKENVDYTVKYANNVNVSTAGSKKAPTVTITGKGNYTGTQTLKFAITKKAFYLDAENSITVKVSDAKYTGKAVKPSVVVKDGTKTLKNGTDYTLVYENNVELTNNQAMVSIIGKGNYYGEVSQVFRIYKKDITPAVVVIENQTYTGTTITPEVVVYADKNAQKAGTPLVKGKDYLVNYPETGNVEAGKGTVTILGRGEYGGTITAEFDIVPKDMETK